VPDRRFSKLMMIKKIFFGISRDWNWSSVARHLKDIAKRIYGNQPIDWVN
jgi:hypothetical protein